jgi:hypothetical protein
MFSMRLLFHWSIYMESWKFELTLGQALLIRKQISLKNPNGINQVQEKKFLN